MALQVFGTPAPRRKNRSAHIAEALTGVAQAGADAYEKHTQARLDQSRLNEENKAIKEAYDIDLSGIFDPKERQTILASELSSKAKQKTLDKKKEFAENIFKGRNQKEGGISVGGMLRGQGGEVLEPEVSFRGNSEEAEEELTAADIPDHEIFQLSLVDEHAANLVRKMKDAELKKREKADEDVASEQFSKGYDAILSGDENDFQQVLRDKKTPFRVKSRLTELKDRQQVRKSVEDREARARQTMVQKAYEKAISNQNALLKGYVNTDERKQIKEKIAKLESLQKADLQKLTRDPNSYNKLKIWNTDAASHLEEENEIEEGNEEEEDFLNSLTDDEVRELIEESNGDLEIAKKIALQRYGR